MTTHNRGKQVDKVSSIYKEREAAKNRRRKNRMYTDRIIRVLYDMMNVRRDEDGDVVTDEHGMPVSNNPVGSCRYDFSAEEIAHRMTGEMWDVDELSEQEVSMVQKQLPKVLEKLKGGGLPFAMGLNKKYFSEFRQQAETVKLSLEQASQCISGVGGKEIHGIYVPVGPDDAIYMAGFYRYQDGTMSRMNNYDKKTIESVKKGQLQADTTRKLRNNGLMKLGLHQEEVDKVLGESDKKDKKNNILPDIV